MAGLVSEGCPDQTPAFGSGGNSRTRRPDCKLARDRGEEPEANRHAPRAPARPVGALPTAGKH